MRKIPVVLCVGLIGSGKSTVLQVFKGKGEAVISTDILWKQVVYQESNRERLIRVLGEDVLLEDGSPNLLRLRALLFSLQPEEQASCLVRMKNLSSEFEDMFYRSLHTEIEARALDQGVDMVVVESAMALSDGWDKKIKPDHIVSVHCPKDIRLSRILKRNPNVGLPVHLAVMGMQPSDEEYLELSTKAMATQISTHCSVENTITESNLLHRQLRRLFAC